MAICRDLRAWWSSSTSRWARTPATQDEPVTAALADLVGAVAKGAPVMVSPGVLRTLRCASSRPPAPDYQYALYQETHTRELYERLRVGQPFAARVAARSAARRAAARGGRPAHGHRRHRRRPRGLHRREMREAGWEQVRVMTFVPQAGTPLADTQPAGNTDELLLTIAAMRLAIAGPVHPGLARRGRHRRPRAPLQASADVVTSIVPPTVGLAGVSQAELDIDEGYRTVHSVLRTSSAAPTRHRRVSRADGASLGRSRVTSCAS